MKKRRLFCLLTIAGLLSISSATFAADDPLAGVIAAIKQLGVEVQAISLAASKGYNEMLYQLDQNLATAMQANSQKSGALANAGNTAAANTQNQLDTSLMEFPEQVINASQLTDPQTAADINNRQQLLANLTTNTPGNDTLYLNSMTDPLASLDNISKPSTTYDNYFNFDSLITPSAYSTDQQQASQSYIEYVTQQYQSLLGGIDFAKLKSKINDMSPDKRAQALYNFVTNPVYQQYQLAVRSLLASKSVALSNLNLLHAERTPVKDLATQTGMPNNPNLPAGYASPLEVENYIANQRVNSPDWYKEIKTASPTAVQREQVLILAEIESQLQRSHLDNERILATLSAMLLQSSQSNQLLLQTKAQDVNAIIDPKANQSK